MPYAGNTNEVRSKEACLKTYGFLRNTKLYFTTQNAWSAPYASTYVSKLLKESPAAKEAVKGKLAVVTGVTKGGAGYYVAEELAVTAEMHVVLMGRNETKLKAAIEAIEQTAARRKVEGVTMYETKYDLNSLQSALTAAEFVRKLANDKYDGKLHVLINNAGALVTEYGVTEEGIERNVGRNYMCPHLLTDKLLPLMKKAATPEYKPRVVHVSSLGHSEGRDFDPATMLEDPANGGAPEGTIVEVEGEGTDGNTTKTKKFASELLGPGTQYGASKMGMVADAVALSKQHPEINFTSQQPGSIASNFVGNAGVAGIVYYYGFYFFQFVASQGARASLRAALDPDFNTVESLQGGVFLNAHGDPWVPDDPTLKNPATNEPFDMPTYADYVVKHTDQVIAKILNK